MVARAPRKRMYRTMQGRMIDIEKLRAANEDIRAVGNMNVNARGDVIGPNGNFSYLSNFSKWILSIGMILGRLELFAVLVLFIPSFWRKY